VVRGAARVLDSFALSYVAVGWPRAPYPRRYEACGHLREHVLAGIHCGVVAYLVFALYITCLYGTYVPPLCSLS
jgi:hypothetical protein